MSGHVVAWENVWAVGLPGPMPRRRSLRLPAVPRRALAAAAQVTMGAGLGALFGAAGGNPAFWLLTGTALGAALSLALARDRTNASAAE